MSHCSYNNEHTDEYISKEECGQKGRFAVASSTIGSCSHGSKMQLRTAWSNAFLSMSPTWIFWIAKASSQDWRKFVSMSDSDPQQICALKWHWYNKVFSANFPIWKFNEWKQWFSILTCPQLRITTWLLANAWWLGIIIIIIIIMCHDADDRPYMRIRVVRSEHRDSVHRLFLIGTTVSFTQHFWQISMNLIWKVTNLKQ